MPTRAARAYARAVSVSVSVLLAPLARAHHPHDPVEVVAVSPDFANDRTLICASPWGSMNLLLISRDGGLTWRAMHNGLRGNTYKAVAFAPDWAVTGTVYVGTSDGGFQVSTDFGNSWSAPPPSLPGGIYDIEVAKLNRAGKHALFVNRNGWQLFRTDDRGASFQQLPLPNNGAGITSIGVSPAFDVDRLVIVGTDDSRIHVSRDGGLTWSSGAAPAPVRDIEISPNVLQDRVAWLATWGAGVVTTLVPATATSPPTYAPISTIPDAFVNDVDLVVPPNGQTPLFVYAATRTLGLFGSIDSGANWLLLPVPVHVSAQSDNHFQCVTVSPNWFLDGRVYCGTFEGMVLGTDYGLSWFETLINRTRMGRGVVLSPNYPVDQTVFVGGYGQAMLRSRDRGATWQTVGAEFRGGSIYEIEVSPTFASDQIVMGGVIFGVRVSNNGGDSWTKVDFPFVPGQPNPHGTGEFVIRDIAFSPAFATDGRVYALSEMGVVYGSADRGVTWSVTVQQPIQEPYTRTIVLSPNYATDSTMFVAGPGLFVSLNGGQTFAKTYGGRIVEDALAVPPDFATTGEFYAAVSGVGFVILDNYGLTSTASNTGLDGYLPTAIRVSPDFVNDSTIFAMTSGGGLYVSTNRGQSWAPAGVPTQLTGNARALAVSPDYANDQTVFAGVFDGHIRSTDGGATWQLATNYESYDDNRDPWRFQSAWTQAWSPGNLIYGHRRSAQPGDRASLPFDGTGVRLHGVVGPDRGRARIWIDGVAATVVDTYAPTPKGFTQVFEVQNLPAGLHWLEVEVLGTANPASTGVWVGVDEAQVFF